MIYTLHCRNVWNQFNFHTPTGLSSAAKIVPDYVALKDPRLIQVSRGGGGGGGNDVRGRLYSRQEEVRREREGGKRERESTLSCAMYM